MLPFQVLAGTAGSHSYFSLELARQIHAQALPGLEVGSS
jgi:hypothetical protein